MLAAALLLVLLILATEVLLPMARGARRGNEQIHLQQLTQLALDRIATDLACAPPEGVTLTSLPGGPTVLSVQRLSDVTPTGGQIWSDHLSVYWLDRATARLWHRDYPPQPPVSLRALVPDAPYSPTATELQQLLATPGPTARVLAPNVDLWLVDMASGPTVRLRLKSQDEEFELARRVHMRNQRF